MVQCIPPFASSHSSLWPWGMLPGVTGQNFPSLMDRAEPLLMSTLHMRLAKGCSHPPAP